MSRMKMAGVIASSFEDARIDGLSFKLAETTPYTTNRRSSTFV